MIQQVAAGIATRLYARAMVVASPEHPTTRFAFVSLDACMATQGVTRAVLRALAKTHGDLYTEQNVALSGTHTHSGPGGYHQYVLYQVTSLGFVQESFDALVDGIVEVPMVATCLRRVKKYMQPKPLQPYDVGTGDQPRTCIAAASGSVRCVWRPDQCVGQPFPNRIHCQSR